MSEGASALRERWPEALVVAVLAIAVAWRWAPQLRFDQPLGDELVYAWAIDAIERGESPYQVGGYLYPPTLVWLGSLAVEAGFSTTGFLRGLRLVDALALALLAWGGARWAGISRRRSFPLAAAFILLSPAVFQSMDLGNPTPLVAVLILGALAAGGGVLGVALLVLGLALKPMALPLLAVWLVAGERRERLSALVAGVLFGLTLLLLPWGLEWLERGSAGAQLPFGRTLSLHRLAWALGWTWAPGLLMAGLAVAGGLMARRFASGERDRACFALATIPLALPIVWNHSLVVTWPLQALAVASAWPGGRARQRGLLVLGLVAVNAGEGATNIGQLAPFVQALMTMPQWVGMAVLTVLSLRRKE